MLKDIHFPTKLNGEKLDAYLAQGWYRIGQIIFTTDHIPHPGGWYRVFWLRFRLDKFSFGKTQQKLLSGNSKQFDVSINPLAITPEMESLYNIYYAQLDFHASPSIQHNLYDYNVFGENLHRVYDSDMIEVKQDGQLIAAGIFDNGKNSIAGILNFYHPGWKKYSLGKYLMLLKLQHARERGMQFYYPGYIAADYSKFDYKLFPGKEAAEIFDPVSGVWLPYSPSLIHELKQNVASPDAMETE